MSLVIAEFCQNHNGDKGILKDMIWAAAEAGADYGKIQAIFADELTYRERFQEGRDGAIRRPFEPEYRRLKGLEVPFEDYPWFMSECDQAGIRPMTTIFTRRQIPIVAGFGMDAVKVASYDCASFPLLAELKDHFHRLFVSTGATLDHEIENAAGVLKGSLFTFLHCVTVYPTPLDELHLARMSFLRTFTPSVGFSDHSSVDLGLQASAAAIYFGADVIERHFTVLGRDETKDGPVSIGPEQLKRLCELAHGDRDQVEAYVREQVGAPDRLLGRRSRELSHDEVLNRDYYRGRFASRVDGEWVYNWEERPAF